MKLKAKILKTDEKKGYITPIIKGVIVALAISLVAILLFAFLLRWTNISDSLIAPVNQVIKGISIFLGVFFGLKKVKQNGIINGLLIGFFYTIIAFLVFSLLDGAFHFDRSLLNDILFGTIIGAICGIICVNLKKF